MRIIAQFDLQKLITLLLNIIYIKKNCLSPKSNLDDWLFFITKLVVFQLLKFYETYIIRINISIGLIHNKQSLICPKPLVTINRMSFSAVQFRPESSSSKVVFFLPSLMFYYGVLFQHALRSSCRCHCVISILAATFLVVWLLII